MSDARRGETVELVMRAGGLGRGLNTLMDRPRAASSDTDRTGVQLFLEKRGPLPPQAIPPRRDGKGTLSRALWVLDGILILTALSVLFIPSLDRIATVVLGSWLIALAAGVGVLAILGRR